MTVKRCPRCKQRYSVPKNTIDFVHECNSGNKVLDEEDTLDITKNNWNLQGAPNKLFGTNAWIKGKDLERKTKRGIRASTVKTEQHYEFIKLEE